MNTLNLHNVRNIEIKPVVQMPASSSNGSPWALRKLYITDRSGETMEIIMFADYAEQLLIDVERVPAATATPATEAAA